MLSHCYPSVSATIFASKRIDILLAFFLTESRQTKKKTNPNNLLVVTKDNHVILCTRHFILLFLFLVLYRGIFLVVTRDAVAIKSKKHFSHR